MIYRLGRHRRRNLYAQHGPVPSDDDLFVALFDDELVAARVCQLLNAELSQRPFDETAVTLRLLSDFPARLKAHRYQLNMTQQEVADIVGVHPRTVGTWECGHRTPEPSVLMRLLNWMVRSAGDPPRPGRTRESAAEAARRGNVVARSRR